MLLEIATVTIYSILVNKSPLFFRQCNDLTGNSDRHDDRIWSSI